MRPIALLIHSSDFSPLLLVRALEAKGIAVQPGQNLAEAQRLVAMLAADEIKFAFIDAALCQGHEWDELIARLMRNSRNAIVARYHSANVHHLHQLLGKI